MYVTKLVATDGSLPLFTKPEMYDDDDDDDDVTWETSIPWGGVDKGFEGANRNISLSNYFQKTNVFTLAQMQLKVYFSAHLIPGFNSKGWWNRVNG